MQEGQKQHPDDPTNQTISVQARINKKKHTSHPAHRQRPQQYPHNRQIFDNPRVFFLEKPTSRPKRKTQTKHRRPRRQTRNCTTNRSRPLTNHLLPEQPARHPTTQKRGLCVFPSLRPPPEQGFSPPAPPPPRPPKFSDLKNRIFPTKGPQNVVLSAEKRVKFFRGVFPGVFPAGFPASFRATFRPGFSRGSSQQDPGSGCAVSTRLQRAASQLSLQSNSSVQASSLPSVFEHVTEAKPQWLNIMPTTRVYCAIINLVLG